MRRANKLTALTLTLVLALSITFSAVPLASGVTAADAAAAQKRADEARRKAQEASGAAAQLEAEAKAFDAEISAAQAKIASIQPQKNEAVRRADEIRGEVAALEAQIAAKRLELGEVQARYDEQKRLLEGRVNALYRQGTNFMLEFILTATSIDDFISRTEYAQRILKSNSDAAEALSVEYAKLTEVKLQLDQSLEKVNVRRAEAEAIENELLDLDAQYRRALADQETLAAQKTAKMNELLKDAKAFAAAAAAEEAESRKILAELAANTGSGVISGGILAWPVPSSSRISSAWGDTEGRTKPHNAIDIAAPSGSAVVAANDGKVIRADYGWSGGYGNRIWIDHGEGVVTCYNHLLAGSFTISNGSQVKRGQRIASVGSSGSSTGPHLDFQVVVNGVFKNPMSYLR